MIVSHQLLTIRYHKTHDQHIIAKFTKHNINISKPNSRRISKSREGLTLNGSMKILATTDEIQDLIEFGFRSLLGHSTSDHPMHFNSKSPICMKFGLLVEFIIKKANIFNFIEIRAVVKIGVFAKKGGTRHISNRNISATTWGI